VPIYEQIFKQISNKILSGDLPPGASLPAIRVLAKDLGVSIITVKKAYELLQSQHLINSVVGKGTIISKLSSDFIEDSIRNQLEKKIDEVIKFGIEVGIDSKEIKEIILLKLDDNGEI
jgi:transcriptional regulator, gntR